MNKGELVNAVASDVGISKTSARTVLDSIVDTVAKSLKKGDKVTLVGFESFPVMKRKTRKGRNPQTGKVIKIPAKKVVKFKVGAKLGKALNNSVSNFYFAGPAHKPGSEKVHRSPFIGSKVVNLEPPLANA